MNDSPLYETCHSLRVKCKRLTSSRDSSLLKSRRPGRKHFIKPKQKSRTLCDQGGSRETCREAARIGSFREGASKRKGHKDTQRRSQRSQEATKLRNHTLPAERKLKKAEMSKPAGRQQGYEASEKVPASQRVTKARSDGANDPKMQRSSETIPHQPREN